MRRLILVFAVMGVAVLLASGAALAITGGFEDVKDPTTDQFKFPNVGALVGSDGDGAYTYCTGTLISPRVFLTAAHCAPRTGDAVSFDNTLNPKDNPNPTLYSICRGSACEDPTRPGYPFDGRYKADPNGYDIAAVKFNEPIQGITPARLPSSHQFDSVAKDQKFTAVGYGEQGGTSTVYDIRTYATSTFKSISQDYLRLSQNLNQGDGGTCYGDSGGPNFLGKYDDNPDTPLEGFDYNADGISDVPIIAGITNTGDTWCKATNVTLRLDNEAARKFLSSQFFEGQGVTLP